MAHLDIRCRKQEKLDLLLPDKFMKAYSLTALRLMDQARSMNQLRRQQEFSDAAFDILYRFVYEYLSTFGSWIMADVMFGSSMRVKKLMGFVVDNEMESLSTSLSGLRMKCVWSNGTNLGYLKSHSIGCVTAYNEGDLTDSSSGIQWGSTNITMHIRVL